MTYPIDFVLPWVDGNNHEWQQIREKYIPKQLNDRDTTSSARFRDMETLKYTLRAIEQNCPWYNKIYLITKGYAPDWLNTEHPKIEIIREDELFIDKSHLPVFNSVSIEMNLVNLSQLSEKFVYMNDDFIIYNRIESSRFFKEGKPVDFFSHNPIPRNSLYELLKGRDSWIHSINNVLTLYNKKFAPITLDNRYLFDKSYSIVDKINNFIFKYLLMRITWIKHWHHPQPMLKQTLQEVYKEFGTEMMQSSQNRFRSKSDLNQYMYRYWQLLTENFYPYKYNDDLIANLDSLKILHKMIATLKKHPEINFVCFNDSVHLSDAEYETVKKALTAFLEEQFSKKASFEK